MSRRCVAAFASALCAHVARCWHTMISTIVPLQEMQATDEARRGVERRLLAKSPPICAPPASDPPIQWHSFRSEGTYDEYGWGSLQENEGDDMGRGGGSGIELDMERARCKV